MERRVRLQATPPLRTVEVGGDDASRRSRVTGHIAALVGSPPGVVLTGSCTAALEAVATVLALRPGDEVVVPAFTFPTTATAFLGRGASVRFADVRPDTLTIDPADVAEKVGPRTRAVVVMHYAGVGADVTGLRAAVGADVDIVEDAAHGIFGAVDGRPLGTLGRFGALSFHRTKNLSSSDGGALVVNDPDDLDRVDVAVDKGTNRVAFDQGRTPSYEWSGPGSSARMPDPCVAVLEADLDEVGPRQRRRAEVWDRYAEALGPWAEEAGAGLPVVPAGRQHPAHLFFVVLPRGRDRDAFVAHCRRAGVEVARHFGSLPASAYGRGLADPADACPVAGDLAGRLVRLPLHHQVSDADVDHVVEVVTAGVG
ncbi:aminotransferase class I/II-fold pyridoxal phosphate-dependent enzyme [Iamia majanohamensis]|uniref:Aminotransferase class I/II-fold pyridoxal phosphate-dependent enzyme n=1 Tax=Iamia majanohamensis TaxID=467976 RepID=A0AAE9Y7L7_9ACTN|nr:aminotransferase class I/II-fold pyridoxal phosphate-dependent enzyme [Iamia majanohamensis]WCO65908.1 aminotransferase class I/II-fold pyridoxal phosphate-dependent enzyme [Iamia majanohamensis]